MENNSPLLAEIKKSEILTQEEPDNEYQTATTGNVKKETCYRIGDMLINVEHDITYLYPADGMTVQFLKEKSVLDEKSMKLY